jgi:hypothetical protein
MITSATEFIRLRESDDLTEQKRASTEFAEMNIWLEVIERYPDFKVWVIHNKEIQTEILELLSKDPNPEIRSAVARKRKINKAIKENLSKDPDENVRFALRSNTNLSLDELNEINTEDSMWLKEKLDERIKSAYS